MKRKTYNNDNETTIKKKMSTTRQQKNVNKADKMEIDKMTRGYMEVIYLLNKLYPNNHIRHVMKYSNHLLLKRNEQMFSLEHVQRVTNRYLIIEYLKMVLDKQIKINMVNTNKCTNNLQTIIDHIYEDPDTKLPKLEGGDCTGCLRTVTLEHLSSQITDMVELNKREQLIRNVPQYSSLLMCTVCEKIDECTIEQILKDAKQAVEKVKQILSDL